MPGFSAEWLTLREPADHAARSKTLTRSVADAVAAAAAPGILDLACGTGSNWRYLSAMLGPTHTSASTKGEGGPTPERVATDLCVRPQWLLVDHDPELLARIPPSADVDTRCLDLSTLNDASIFAGRSLVTASALLDLVSDEWLRALAARCAEVGAAALFALNYDGRIECAPEDADDGTIVALVNRHQQTDKGFGPALGPEATDRAEHWFAAHDYRIQRERSDWLLPPSSAELQRQLIDGWTQAATDIAPEQIRLIDRWRERRLAHLAAGWSQIIVGHEDIVGILGA
jgi:hypothetical protein